MSEQIRKLAESTPGHSRQGRGTRRVSRAPSAASRTAGPTPLTTCGSRGVYDAVAEFIEPRLTRLLTQYYRLDDNYVIDPLEVIEGDVGFGIPRVELRFKGHGGRSGRPYLQVHYDELFGRTQAIVHLIHEEQVGQETERVELWSWHGRVRVVGPGRCEVEEERGGPGQAPQRRRIPPVPPGRSVQAKNLPPGPAIDEYEREADRNAERITEDLDGKTSGRTDVLAVTALTGRPNPADRGRDAEHLLDSLHSTSKPLPIHVRSRFEPFFGDLGSVEVHTGNDAGTVARDLGARAITTGSHIIFGSGEYDPASRPGQYLLAHELTHVVQQLKQRPLGVDHDPVQRTPISSPAGAIDFDLRPKLIPARDPIVQLRHPGIVAQVFFGRGLALLDRSNAEVIIEIGTFLSFFEGAMAFVDGHASTESSSGFNQILSEKRAETVARVLRDASSGVVGIGTEAHGENEPLREERGSDQDVERSRQWNRRVEILVTLPPSALKLFPPMQPSALYVDPDLPGPIERSSPLRGETPIESPGERAAREGKERLDRRGGSEDLPGTRKGTIDLDTLKKHPKIKSFLEKYLPWW